MKRILLALSIILAATSLLHANEQNRGGRKPITTEVSQTEKEEWENLKSRFTKYSPYISGLVWTLIHSYASQSETKRGLALLQSISIAVASHDPATLRKFNAPQGFKQKLVGLINARDETLSGFGASMLAIIGDQEYAPHIATLLDRRKASRPYHEVTVRGQAATALGLLGAKQYAVRIALLLKSKNRYDRSGAATALGLLKATAYADDVIRVLLFEDVGVGDDSSPIHALFEMGVAAKYTKEIARVLDDEIPGDRTETAAYALARLGAKEHAKDIAKLLKNEYRRRHAAKALALLGAREYTAEIVLLLKDKNSFNREGGALALGILGAKEHVAAVAELLKDEEAWVRRAAADALVLMEANEYAREALPIIAVQKEGPYFDGADFNSVVTEQALELNNRFTILLARMKTRLAAPRPK